MVRYTDTEKTVVKEEVLIFIDPWTQEAKHTSVTHGPAPCPLKGRSVGETRTRGYIKVSMWKAGQGRVSRPRID